MSKPMHMPDCTWSFNGVLDSCEPDCKAAIDCTCCTYGKKYRKSDGTPFDPEVSGWDRCPIHRADYEEWVLEAMGR